MKTLIVHDNGKILSTMNGGEYNAPAVLVADVPDGYIITGVDTATGEAVLKKAPPTLEERIAELEATNAALLGEE